eukprot:TRINITY_DN8544_c0_g1_i2.p3 TRINITY_DN8544_c0_g1~~TRINITY_DN8544_c0_g1_i2.p3  ORF type:complete len:153 (-),score=24.35 TRINITY_DN8544_c0_g1_i2:195-653(-)
MVGNTLLESVRGTVDVEAPFESKSNFQEKVWKALRLQKKESFWEKIECDAPNDISVLVWQGNGYRPVLPSDLANQEASFAVLLRPKASQPEASASGFSSLLLFFRSKAFVFVLFFFSSPGFCRPARPVDFQKVLAYLVGSQLRRLEPETTED